MDESFAWLQQAIADQEAADERPMDEAFRSMTAPVSGKAWLRATDQVEAWFGQLPATEIGCLYLRPARWRFPSTRVRNFRACFAISARSGARGHGWREGDEAGSLPEFPGQPGGELPRGISYVPG